jgi:hypothetical protein
MFIDVLGNHKNKIATRAYYPISHPCAREVNQSGDEAHRQINKDPEQPASWPLLLIRKGHDFHEQR